MSRLELKGALAERRQKVLELSIRGKGLIKGIDALLSMAQIKELSEIDVPGVHSLAADLNDVYDRYTVLKREIAEIDKELE